MGETEVRSAHIDFEFDTQFLLYDIYYGTYLAIGSTNFQFVNEMCGGGGGFDGGG